VLYVTANAPEAYKAHRRAGAPEATYLESGAFNVFISAAIKHVQWVVPALLACAAMHEGAGSLCFSACLHARCCYLFTQELTQHPDLEIIHYAAIIADREASSCACQRCRSMDILHLRGKCPPRCKSCQGACSRSLRMAAATNCLS
jgi:hypothetical protein